MSHCVGIQLFGRPLFSAPLPVDAPRESLFSKVKAITQKRPSAHHPNSFLAKIERLFWKIISFFISMRRPSLSKYQSLIASSSFVAKSGITAGKTDALELFHRHLSDEDTQLGTLFKNCESLLEEIKRLNSITNDDQRVKKRIELRDQIRSQVQNLKKPLLLPATSRNDVNIFYLLDRKENGYELKIIGCDDWMTELSGIPSKKIGGKERVQSQIAFTQIPSRFFSDERVVSLFCDPLLEDSFNTATVKSHLKELSAHAVDLSHAPDLWVIKSSNPRKALSLTTQVFADDAHQNKGVRKRLDFQTKLLALFDFYKEVRDDLHADSDQAVALKKFVKEIAREATLLGKKNYLSKPDLKAVQKDLVVIENSIKKVNSRKQAPLNKISGLSSLKVASEDLPLKATIKPPAPLPVYEAKPKKDLEPVKSLNNTMALDGILPCTFLTKEEQQALSSDDLTAALVVIKKQIQEAKEHASNGEKELAVAAAMDVVHHFRMDLKQPSFWEKISGDILLDAQKQMIQLSKLILENRTESIPVPSQAITMLALSYLVETLRFVVNPEVREERFSSSMHYPVRNLIHELALCKNHTKPYEPSTLQRCFLKLDCESHKTLNYLLESKDGSKKFPKPPNLSRRQIDEALILDFQQQECLHHFFDVPYVKGFPDEVDFMEKAFTPQRIQKWTKSFKNPLFLAALRQMKIDGRLANIIYKLSAEGKFVGSISYIGEKPDYKTDKYTHAELNEMQKDLDRLESLKLPEAIVDNPQIVFDKQMEDLLNRLKENDEENEFTQESLTHQLRKEELTDLLNMLRGKYPQMEAVAFLKTHPHLLSNPDIRNYLEQVLFDVSGSYLADTFKYNQAFATSLPEILAGELRKYRHLAEADPAYFDHHFFVLSLVRKFEAFYRANQMSSPQIQLKGILDAEYSHRMVLNNPSLHAYHYKAAIEFLAARLEQDSLQNHEISEIVYIYHKLQTFSRNDGDFDPGEMEVLRRRYALFAKSLKQYDAKALSPILSYLSDKDFTGQFPVFFNDQYEFDLLRGKLVDKATGGTLVAMPPAAAAHPAYKSAFGDVDAPTLSVRLSKQGKTEIYIVEDKSGLKGRVEKEGDKISFYKHFSDRSKTLQVHALKPNQPKISKKYGKVVSEIFKKLPVVERAAKALLEGEEKRDDGLGALRCLAGDALYFNPGYPNEGFCLDSKGKTQFKVKFKTTRNSVEIESVIDCRGKKESIPYQVAALELYYASSFETIGTV